MTENDFPALGSAARDSLIGQASASLTAAMGRAIANASVTRLVRAQTTACRGLTPAETIRLSAIALMTACLATAALSRIVPLYVSMAIPGIAFLALALACAATAAGADTVANHWSRSRTRRLTAWLRGA